MHEADTVAHISDAHTSRSSSCSFANKDLKFAWRVKQSAHVGNGSGEHNRPANHKRAESPCSFSFQQLSISQHTFSRPSEHTDAQTIKQTSSKSNSPSLHRTLLPNMATQQQTSLRSLTVDEVAKVSQVGASFRHLLIPQHNKEGDLWVVVDSIVYDLSKFGAMHPGGLGVLLDEDVGEWQAAGWSGHSAIYQSLSTLFAH